MFSFMFAHEAHHRGQAILLARQLGYRLAEEVANGIWSWEELWKGCGLLPARDEEAGTGGVHRHGIVGDPGIHAAANAECNVKQVVPFFRVSDRDRSLRFYRDGLGFSMRHSWVVDDGWQEEKKRLRAR
jgi:hypothetical protein